MKVRLMAEFLRIDALARAAQIAGTDGLASVLQVTTGKLKPWLSGQAPVPLRAFLMAVDVVLEDRKSSGSVLIISRLNSGFWRVKLGSGEPLLDLYTRKVAARFSRTWAKTHLPCEVRFLVGDGKLAHTMSYRA